ncbi:NAD(P)/FAD-dependent oxidoreductase [Pedobacter sp. MR2016-19]|uniref:NAD(P)/FAD-dependent oxidoreductase n=1 Tax=Pedobacter sp. MR2016-19 TaxID=2780089 RepID=UPI001875D58D|nr:NAD(P)/FAD-dependent oxidoreductase [Pedobacter sp. MR2016-19]MBE5319001.1 NAD(P)/FAD-dependent oxidoreductase [Pedobacter sp. MR2016-19]
MQAETEILIIGGGLAGLTAALHLNKMGLNVILIEKDTYPHHKVCGEYISNEVLPYFEWLGLDIENLAPALISDLLFTSNLGKSIQTKLPLGGFGLSRYTIDHYLYTELIRRKVNIVHDRVVEIKFTNNQFTVSTANNTFVAAYVIGAYGKRSAIDIKLNRSFINKQSPYLAVKAHYKADFPNNVVSLHNFEGGYCGVSKVENDRLNICYLTNYESFKKHKNLLAFQENVLYKNSYLKAIFENASDLFDVPLTISQISFEAKEPVNNHILMIGDTAGLIHPLCGNGMAMAIHSAKIVSELLHQRIKGQINSRTALEESYTAGWNREFKSRLKTGRMLSSLLRNNKFESLAMSALTKMPFLLHKIIKKTHGKPITISP